MTEQSPKRRRQPSRSRHAATVAMGVLLVVILGVFGYVNYRQWVAPSEPVFPVTEKPDPGRPNAPAVANSSGLIAINGIMTAPPQQSTAEQIQMWNQMAALRPSPLQAARQHSTDDLIAAVDKAFAEPATELKPAVVFLPVVDGEGKIRSDGGVLGQMAAYSAAYTPHHRIDLDVPFLHDEWIDAGCDRPGVRLTPAMIDLCTAALETKLYVLPRLESGEGKDELTVEFHGDKTHPDRTFHHKLAADGLNTAPGLEAQDVLEALGVLLDDAELAVVLKPQVKNDQELDFLTQALATYPAGSSEDSWINVFLMDHPHCALAWNQYLMWGHNLEREAMLTMYAKVKPPCDRLQVSTARLKRDSGRAEEALLDMLKLVSSNRDASCLSTLTRCGVALGDERLINHLLEVWQKADSEYSGCLERANVLTDWAWQARGTGWGSTVSTKAAKRFQERLGRARDELERAVKRDPSGCRAYVDLMRVARGLGLPPEFMEENFQAAIRAQPHLLLAYTEKWEYLRPRWHGDMEDLLTFGEQCLESDAWNEGIPVICSASIMEVASEAPDEVLHPALKAGPLWNLVVAYYKAAEKHGPPAVVANARNIFARLGVLGEHFDEVIPAYQQLETTGVLDPEIFPDQGEYDYFCDLVQARTGKLPNRSAGRKRDQALSEASVALAAGELDEAEKDLAQYKTGDAANDRLAERYRGSVALGRKLKADGEATLTPQQIIDLCAVDHETFWTVEGDKLIGKTRNFPLGLVLPLDLRKAIITGTLGSEGDIYLMQMEIKARSLQHKVRIGFTPGAGQVTLAMDKRALIQAPYQSGPQPFRLDLGGDEDRLEPAAGVHWPLPAEDRPGCFALTIWPHSGEATLTLSGLRIELKK